MSRPESGGEKIPRRRFVKVAGAAIAVAAVGAGLAYAADTFLKPGGAASAVTTTASATANTGVSQSTSLTTAQSTTQGSPSGGTVSSTPLVPAGSFSIFWITDTQFLSESNPALYRMLTSWIVDNWTAYSGKLVIHTGDVVETGATRLEWQNADEAMSILTSNKIPYSWCAGNHDDFVGGDPTSGWSGNLWTESFDPPTVAPVINSLGYTHWVGDHHDGMNTAMTFSANGLDFLVINLEWNGDDTVLAWAESILSDPAYARHKVIVAPHAYIDAWGSIDDPRWGSTLADFVNGLTNILNAHSSNVFLTLNGHFATDEGFNTPNPIWNRNMLMFDRQDCRDMPDSLTGRGADDSDDTTLDSDRVGGATVTILTFDTGANQISVKTYDIYTGKWRRDAYEEYGIALFPSLSPPPPVHHYPVAVTPKSE